MRQDWTNPASPARTIRASSEPRHDFSPVLDQFPPAEQIASFPICATPKFQVADSEPFLRVDTLRPSWFNIALSWIETPKVKERHRASRED